MGPMTGCGVEARRQGSDSAMQQRNTGTGQVRITINGRSYKIGCDAGEEDRIIELGQYLDGRVAELASRVGQVGDERLLLMAALVLADDLAEAVADLDTARQAPPADTAPPQRSGDEAAGARGAADAGGRGADGAVAADAERINALASRVEGIAARLTSP